LIGTFGEEIPTLSNTEVGIWVSLAVREAEAAWKPLVLVPWVVLLLPLVALTMSSAAITTTTRPTMPQVKRVDI
jgi:hypothetical protein